uniref:Uncharacterized protein n=1 Tax=Octactis speculum TaxID=3111310 RepID=A0A7S2HS55_9STRA|mmetsp:Transcript_8945/g.11408  ORF Transcript_8945/g.11408 Transcript_8945/m.11408 type:complete len:281 (+) Transcript_8945:35-877(+)|eukprot:CAMPEP_0185746368 /NCGR_PEP_ID=MMETSP1174-20130828/4907_1 /TAXON_ID=35687 /ORGANISM="Dictyocha speculum, Strain CCMP1381" /LENGTH=280 /DNA_ID=CAMNT_0028420997 /DNA_START=35 /DNA_END=877 /DNA_ORIENTATION=-
MEMMFTKRQLCVLIALAPFQSAAFAPLNSARVHIRRADGFPQFVTEEPTADASLPVTPVAEEPKMLDTSTAPVTDRIYTTKEVTTSQRAGQNSFDEVDTKIFVRPKLFDEVKLAGDAGFDPFGLATDKAVLLSYRGAELRHARLAMLATIGWPISEIVQPKLAESLGLPAAVSTGGTAPSVLNGGLGSISPGFWLIAVGAAAAIELKSLDMEKSGAMPGDVGFDPLGMDSPQMADAELLNGRLAMLAITGFAVQEAASRVTGVPVPVILETPQFFKPMFQ